MGVGKMRLVRLGVFAFSNVCNSYQIKFLTLVHTLFPPLTLLTTFSIFQFSVIYLYKNILHARNCNLSLH